MTKQVPSVFMSLRDSLPATDFDFVLHLVGCKAPYDSTQCHKCRVAKMLGTEPKCVAECPAEFIMNTNKECVGKERYSDLTDSLVIPREIILYILYTPVFKNVATRKIYKPFV